MPRISGTDIPEGKRTEIALTAVFGIGRKNVFQVLESAQIDGAKRAKDLTEEEIARLQKVIDGTVKVEGDLRKEIQENIKRLRQIGAFRGKRHAAGLPSRGQRTRSNARTRRGRRMTIGALKKDDLLKKQKTEATKAAPAKK